MFVRNANKLERQMRAALEERGFKAVPQMQIRNFFVDVAVPERKVAIEIDSKYWHSFPEAKRQDRAKDGILKLLGWRVVRVCNDDLERDWNTAFASVEDALATTV